MSSKLFANLLNIKNPWPYMENLAAFEAADRIHEKNKESIAILILAASLFSTGLSIPILYTYITYSVSFVPLFMSLTSFVTIPLYSRFVKNEYIVMLLTLASATSITYVCANYVDFNISINPMLTAVLLVVYTHFWSYILKDLDKKIYPVTDAEMKRRKMADLMNEFKKKY